MRQHTVIDVYQQEKNRLESELATLKRRQSLLGWLRLGIIVLTGVLAFQLFSYALFAGWIAIVTGVAVFLFIVSKDANNNKKINNIKSLIQLNEEELRILEGEYMHRFTGEQFLPSEHDYAHDLDLFGKASLYQYVNRCNSEQGKQLLAQNLLKPLGMEEIRKRHEAIKELSPQYQWRHQLAAVSLSTPITLNTQTRTEQWIQLRDEHFTHSSWRIIIPLYSFIAVSLAIGAIVGLISSSVFSFLFLLFFIFSGSLSKRATQSYNYLNGIVNEIESIQQFMEWAERKKADASLLQQLQESVKVNSEPAYVQIRKLKQILDRFDLRFNILVFILLNSFLLWDVRQMMALNQWRHKNRNKLSEWYRLIAEIEVLNSLATLHFNHPEWVFPKFKEQHFYFKGACVGHPLIPHDRRVDNSFHLEGVAKIALITGSNMAGKSTFLRSLGVNIVLAQAGSPVCAGSMTLSPVHLMSSMRIADNLAENTSTFYAELKKLKSIIEVVNRREPIFILLDEILRGTNSLDRHTGSKALMRQLIRKEAVAVIATHDVELAKLEEEHPSSIHNYHFDVQVEGEELYFDYKLKEGVCTSLNASILMKKIGIDL